MDPRQRLIVADGMNAAMLNGARSTVVLEDYPWQWLAPGTALLLTTLAINFVGDGKRKASDEALSSAAA